MRQEQGMINDQKEMAGMGIGDTQRSGILEMRGIVKRYHRFTLGPLDFAVPKGAVVGLVGENGAGKTTLIKAALGLIRVDEGTVSFEGERVLDREVAVKERLGVVFEGSTFPEELKVPEIEKLMKQAYRNWDREQFDHYVGQFGLPEDKRVKEFSKGMRMKLSIAVALSHHAEFLMLDEATSGLDPVMRDELLDILLEFMQDENHSILISSHITGDLEKIADYIAFLRQGELVFYENKDELIYHHGILKISKKDLGQIDKADIVSVRENAYECECLIRNVGQFSRKYPQMTVDRASVEDIVLFYVRGEHR